MSSIMPALYARKTEDGRLQTLHDHCLSVASLAAQNGERIGLARLLRLCGLLHDLGKVSDAYQAYLLVEGNARRGSVLHAALGAVYARRRWARADAASMLTADLVAVAVISHHGRLPDLINSKGDAYLEDALSPARFTAPEERAPEPLDTLLPRFFAQVATEAELDALFDKARDEVRQVCSERITAVLQDFPPEKQDKKSFARYGLLGLLQRDIFSALMDADRLDAYRFEAGDTAETTPPPPWDGWTANLEAKLDGFNHTTPIAQLRAAISLECLSHAGEGAGVYRLCVPTGGGKTFSAIRYALATVKAQGLRRIVYAAPYKAILEQTAEELRKALGHEEQILEHHGDVTFVRTDDAGNRDRQQEQETLKRYQYLTERWDSPMVLTTTVQLLNTLFAGGSGSVRRFTALAGSVIILDEAQCVPLRCWYLLMLAIRYLTGVAGCTVLLCTATQPPWEQLRDYPLPQPKPLIADERRLHEAFRRVKLVDRTAEEAFSPERLACEVLAAREKASSALCILNTKATALSLQAAFAAQMPEGVTLYCLTTYQCPKHRAAILDELRAKLHDKQPVVCVATQLIEAGVDVSFGLTVRALAGLESVTQAAGRCNRHAEREGGDLGEVWLVNMEGEHLGALKEIQDAQARVRNMLRPMQASGDPRLQDLLAPEVLRTYFHTLMQDQNEQMYYLTGKVHSQEEGSLLGALCSNPDGRDAYQTQHHGAAYRPLLAQAFESAGKAFTPIEDATTPVLVPYGAGKAIIDALRTERDVRKLRALLREAQPYCVGVYRQDVEALQQNHALTCRDDLEIYMLDQAYYRDTLGLTTERQQMPDWFA